MIVDIFSKFFNTLLWPDPRPWIYLPVKLGTAASAGGVFGAADIPERLKRLQVVIVNN